MLNVRISPKNAGAVKQIATIEPAPNCHGYTRAITATAAGHQYKIETLNGPRPLYVLTAHEAPTSPNYIIVVFQDYTAESITIRDAQIFKNGSNYPARKESAPRYLKKYSQLAALVHGLITNGATAGPDAAALILAERAAERDKTPAEQATNTRPAEKAAEAPTKPAEPATDTRHAKEPEKPHGGPEKRYNVFIYTTPQGVRRADIRTTSGRPWMDIPAAELDAIRAEIETKSPGRVSFEITEQNPGENATPAKEPEPAHGDSTPKRDPETVEPHPAPGKVCRPTNPAKPTRDTTPPAATGRDAEPNRARTESHHATTQGADDRTRRPCQRPNSTRKPSPHTQIHPAQHSAIQSHTEPHTSKRPETRINASFFGKYRNTRHKSRKNRAIAFSRRFFGMPGIFPGRQKLTPRGVQKSVAIFGRSKNEIHFYE